MSRGRLALLLVALIGCGGPEDPTSFVRPVVEPEHPLALVNPQQQPVRWPIWGGAVAIGELSIRASLHASGESGLQIAGPGAESQRVAIELRSRDGAWTLRETVGDELVQEQTDALSDDGELIVELTPSSVRVVGSLGELALTLSAPLGPVGAEAGLYVSLDPRAELIIDELALSQPLPGHPELGTPLRELALPHAIEIGTAFDIWPPRHDLALESLLGEQFNRLAPTDFYWPTTRGEDQEYFFVPADLAVNYGLIHEQAITGMFLIWDYALPEWLLASDPDALPQIFDDHITTLVERYRGQVDAWIVVNEAIWGLADVDQPADYAQTFWYDALGPEYIERAFQVAHAADPDATLLYNETGAEVLGDKSDFMHAMVGDLLARGVPIDGIGLQFHVDAASPPSPVDVQANMERFAALGLSVHVTELDVSLAGIDLPEHQALELQAAIYVDVLEACLAVPECSNWTVFGLSDRYAWDELGDATPLLLDVNHQPKPAFFAISAALRENPTRSN